MHENFTKCSDDIPFFIKVAPNITLKKTIYLSSVNFTLKAHQFNCWLFRCKKFCPMFIYHLNVKIGLSLSYIHLAILNQYHFQLFPSFTLAFFTAVDGRVLFLFYNVFKIFSIFFTVLFVCLRDL